MQLLLGIIAKYPAIKSGAKRSKPRGDGRVGGEKIAGARDASATSNGRRARRMIAARALQHRERGVALVEMADFADRSPKRAADASRRYRA